jgi:8-oxo-dGTP diphosphatase
VSSTPKTPASAYAPIEVGCEAYIVRGGKLLLGLRSQKKFGAGTWGLPGGRFEFMERADEAIIRELSEELNLKVAPSDLTLLAITDDPRPEINAHHLHITFKVKLTDQQPINAEPNDCDRIEWFPLGSLPDNIFPPHTRILGTIASGQTYSLPKP